MAHFLKDKPLRSTSSGRGGAGNIQAAASANPTSVNAEDLATPTIKTPAYTTGRGGTGNIVPNENPDVARQAQDVEAPAHHAKAPKGTYHWGRGGEGNMTTVGGKDADKEVRKEQEERSRSRARSQERGGGKARRSSFQGIVGKGKEMLGMGGGGKKGEKVQESAVEE
ncbi:hypothetical protein MBLNU230_g5876t1 [Neophaeotheca triangularis]